MNKAFVDYFRCPESFANFQPSHRTVTPNHSGYFMLGENLTCFGQASINAEGSIGAIPDVLSQIEIEGSTCYLPFNPTEVAANLRLERYVESAKKSSLKKLVRDVYYFLRPALPVGLRRHLQRASLKGWDRPGFPGWPVDRTVDQIFDKLMSLSIEANRGDEIPFIWFWPEGQSACAIMTHDVETAAGLEFSRELMDINDSFGIKSSFQIIPEERYRASEADLSAIRSRGFEINVHDLKHDGHLFDKYDEFKQSAGRINQYAKQFKSNGFRSGVLYRNLDWYGEFSFAYDMSVPNNGRLDPQAGGCCTVMPYFVGDILELPVTTTQDYSLFHILESYSLDLWRKQISGIMEQHGLISFIVHPDYLDSQDAKDCYCSLLEYLSALRSSEALWIALPGEVNSWWRQRSEMKLVSDGDEWRIVGEGSERATVAYASMSGNRVVCRTKAVAQPAS
jgi:hypothetical protein